MTTKKERDENALAEGVETAARVEAQIAAERVMQERRATIDMVLKFVIALATILVIPFGQYLAAKYGANKVEAVRTDLITTTDTTNTKLDKAAIKLEEVHKYTNAALAGALLTAEVATHRTYELSKDEADKKVWEIAATKLREHEASQKQIDDAKEGK